MPGNAAIRLIGLVTTAAYLPGLRQLGVGICTVAAAVGCVADQSDPVTPPPSGSVPCVLRSDLYRIDDVKVPLSATEAARYGLDLDADPERRPDNGAAFALSVFLDSWSDAGAMLHSQLRAAFEDDRVSWLVEVQTCAGDAQEPGDYVRIGVHRGAPSGAAGAAEVADSSLPAEGWRFDGGVVRARAGEGMAPASALMDFLGLQSQVIWARGDALAVDLEPSEEGTIQGQLGLGFDDDLRQITADVMSVFYTQKLAEGTSDFARAIDTDDDGEVTPEEFLGSSIVGSMLANDVDLMAEEDGRLVLWPGHDGIKDRLSLGLWFHASLLSD